MMGSTTTVTVNVSPSTYNGPVTLYKNVFSTTVPASAQIAVKVATANAVNGVATFKWNIMYGSTTTYFAYLSDSNGGFQWSNYVVNAHYLRSHAGKDKVRITVAKKRPHGHPGQGEYIKPGTSGNGRGVETDASVVEKSLKIRKHGTRNISTRCPEGSSLLHAEATTNGPRDAIRIVPTEAGARFTSPKANRGYKMRTQLLCRANTAGVRVSNTYALGTINDDRFRLIGDGGTAFGGLGNDEETGLGRNSVLWGGLGMDRLSVFGADSVALGGPGDDILRAHGKIRAMLNGGPGLDILRGSTGPSVLIAADGSGGDRVICRSSTTRVTADRGDRISGPCKKHITWVK